VPGDGQVDFQGDIFQVTQYDFPGGGAGVECCIQDSERARRKGAIYFSGIY